MHLLRHFCGPLAALSVALAVGCSKSPPSTDSDAERAASMARAVEITSRMLQAYREADSYSDHATYVEESVLRGEGVAHELPYYQMSLALDRPNRLRLTFAEALTGASGAQQGFDVASDGEFIRASLPEIPEQMVEKPAPAEFTTANVLPDPLIREMLLERALSDVFPQLAMLLNQSDDDEHAVFPDDSNPRLLPDAERNGHLCYRVATSHPEGTRVLWIDRETYILRSVELPVEVHRQRIDPDRNFLRFSVRIDIEDATFNAEIDESSFTLEPRPGARRVRRFVLPAETDEATAKDAKSAEEEE
jgi:outer membrane lipoprotein-sorting protein